MTPKQKAAFAKRLKGVRCERGNSLRELADRARLSFGHVAGLERGERAPAPGSIVLLARALEVNEQWLEHGTGPRDVGALSEDEARDLARQKLHEFQPEGMFSRRYAQRAWDELLRPLLAADRLAALGGVLEDEIAKSGLELPPEPKHWPPDDLSKPELELIGDMLRLAQHRAETDDERRAAADALFGWRRVLHRLRTAILEREKLAKFEHEELERAEKALGDE